MPYRALGAIPDTFDHRDLIFEAAPPQVIGAIPPTVDMRSWCSPVRDQGQQGSCTGFALAAGLREFLEIKSGTPSPFVALSPAFVYYQERVREHKVGDCNAGAMIRQGLKVLAKIGACPEVDDPYTDKSCDLANPQQADADAHQFTVQMYHRITTLSGLKQALAGGNGCVLGITVYESFESPNAQQTGNIPMPGPGEQILGGHALFCCGYRDDPGVAGGGSLIVKNSWGTGFGDEGYVYLPYAYVTPKLMSDIWTAQ